MKGKKHEANKVGPGPAMAQILSATSAIQELYKESAAVTVGNIPLSAKGKWIHDFFQGIGNIVSIKFRVPKLPISSKKALVQFETAESAKKAIAKNGEEFDSRHVKVNPLFSEPDYESAVLVANLPKTATEEKLWKTFEKWGKVKSVEFIGEKSDKLFATVSFETKEGRRMAAKERTVVDGAVLVVKRRLDPVKRELKIKEKLQKLRDKMEREAAEKSAKKAEIGGPEEEEWGMQPVENPDVEFKNIRGYASKKKQRRVMEELMGKKRPRLTKEMPSVGQQAKEEKKKKHEDRDKREKEAREKIKRVKLKFKKL